MNGERWFAIVVGIFGLLFLARALIIHSALAPIPPGTLPPADVVAEAEAVQRFLWVMFTANFVLGIVALVASPGLFLAKTWARWLWVGASVLVLIAVAVEMATMPIPWSEFAVEVILAALSLFKYRAMFSGVRRAL